MSVNIDMPAPAFCLPADNNQTRSLDDFRGHCLLLYFYPKDDTPGCTQEACSFNENLSRFNDLDVTVVGVSKDSPAKHQKFKAKHHINFPLLSDAESDVCERYGVWTEKSMYGKTYWGIERTTFLIDADGIIRRIWRKVKVAGHTDAVLEAVHQIKKEAA